MFKLLWPLLILSNATQIIHLTKLSKLRPSYRTRTTQFWRRIKSLEVQNVSHCDMILGIVNPSRIFAADLSLEASSFRKSTALAELRFPDIDAVTTSILREHDPGNED